MGVPLAGFVPASNMDGPAYHLTDYWSATAGGTVFLGSLYQTPAPGTIDIHAVEAISMVNWDGMTGPITGVGLHSSYSSLPMLFRMSVISTFAEAYAVRTGTSPHGCPVASTMLLASPAALSGLPARCHAGAARV